MWHRLYLSCGIALTLVTLACSSNKSNNNNNVGDSDNGGDRDKDTYPDLLSGTSDPRTPGAACNGTVKSTSTPATSLPAVPDFQLADGIAIAMIGQVSSARELAALPNGDLLVATNGGSVYLLPNAEGDGAAGDKINFATLPEGPAQGIVFVPSSCTIYVATELHIYAMAYSDGQQSADPGAAIATFRQGPISGTDGDTHVTTSLGFASGKLYAGIGSSCNACKEDDPTRATVQVMDPDGSNMTTKATRFRNAIALAENPDTGILWAGGAGQDDVDPGHLGHPYEFFDPVSARSGLADYGWPVCEEKHDPFDSSADCSATIAPLVEFPAYSTLIGAAFYPSSQTGAHVFPAAYRGGVFITTHGSWHQQADGTYFSPPRVAFVAMNGALPASPVSWANLDPPQWTDIVANMQHSDGVTRTARATGITVGVEGSVFFADDDHGYVFRLRPAP